MLFLGFTDTPISDLTAGKVVKVEREFNNWRYVQIVIYDVPQVQRGWVSREYLATREEAVPLEGKLPVGTKIYYGPNAEKYAGFPEEVYLISIDTYYLYVLSLM